MREKSRLCSFALLVVGLFTYDFISLKLFSKTPHEIYCTLLHFLLPLLDLETLEIQSVFVAQKGITKQAEVCEFRCVGCGKLLAQSDKTKKLMRLSVFVAAHLILFLKVSEIRLLSPTGMVLFYMPTHLLKKLPDTAYLKYWAKRPHCGVV